MAETLLQDLRYGARMLLKAPGFSLVAVITLALGIGANTAIFSIVNALLVRSLPVQHPEQLVIIGDPSRVHSLSSGTPRADLFSHPLYKELVANNQVFSGMVATGDARRLMVATDENGQAQPPQQASGRMVSGNYFQVLGVQPVIGRTFTAEEDTAPGADPYMVISYAYWKRRFNLDPTIVGRVVKVNGYPITIIGVTPQGYTGEAVGSPLDCWLPLMMQPQMMPGYKFLDNEQNSWLLIIARLKPGITVQQAETAVNLEFQQIAHSSFANRFDRDNQDSLRKLKLDVTPGAQGISSLRTFFRKPLILLMVIVGLVLLIACVNVANLLLARASGRQTEIAVRLAIGASPGRLARQLLTESLLLAAIGGAVGLLVSLWASAALVRLATRSTTMPLDTAPDARVFLFTAAAVLLTGLLFGLAPALRAYRFELTPALKGTGSRTASAGAHGAKLGKYLVGAQVALSVLVLFTAGLLISSLKKLLDVNTGYEPDHIVILRLDFAAAGYEGGRYLPGTTELLTRLRQLPGVTGATFSENGLFSGTESADGILVPGFTPGADKDKVAYNDTVGPEYFSALHIPVKLGREITAQDTPASPRVAVVNETFARFYFKDANPIGRKFAEDDEKEKEKPFEIIGVVPDIRDHALDKPVLRRFYMPVTQGLYQPKALNFELRTAGDATGLVNPARKVVQDFDVKLPILSVHTVHELINDEVGSQAAVAKLSSLFAALALLLACVGLYGLMSYSVAGRTREIGVRMALGASRGNLVWLVLREAMTMVVVGIIIGLPLAMAASRGLRSLLFQATAIDPLPLAASTLLLGSVAAFAAWIPARRASKVDPMVALRYE